VGKWEVSYPELPAQFALAGVDPAGPNHWSKVYDFSPNSDGKEHWSFLPDQETLRPSLLQPLPSGLCGGEVMELVGRAGTSPGKQSASPGKGAQQAPSPAGKQEAGKPEASKQAPSPDDKQVQQAQLEALERAMMEEEESEEDEEEEARAEAEAKVRVRVRVRVS